MVTGVNKTTQTNTKPVPALQQRGDMDRIVIKWSSCSRGLTTENQAKPQEGRWSTVNPIIN